MKKLSTLSFLLLAVMSTANAASTHKIKVSRIETESVTEHRTAHQLLSQGKVTGLLICDELEGERDLAILSLGDEEENEVQINFTKDEECSELVDTISAKLVEGDVVVTFDNEKILAVQN